MANVAVLKAYFEYFRSANNLFPLFANFGNFPPFFEKFSLIRRPKLTNFCRILMSLLISKCFLHNDCPGESLLRIVFSSLGATSCSMTLYLEVSLECNVSNPRQWHIRWLKDVCPFSHLEVLKPRKFSGNNEIFRKHKYFTIQHSTFSSTGMFKLD